MATKKKGGRGRGSVAEPRVAFTVTAGPYAGATFAPVTRLQVRVTKAEGRQTDYVYANSRWWPLIEERRSTYAVQTGSQLHTLLTRASYEGPR